MTEMRPYPNVVATESGKRFKAYHPISGGESVFLGSFRTPEPARAAVLLAQAEHLEAKAAGYRAEAARLTASH